MSLKNKTILLGMARAIKELGERHYGSDFLCSQGDGRPQKVTLGQT